MPDAATQPTRVTPGGVWRLLRQALAGTHQDYTQGSIERAIILLAVPMVLEMLMESLFGVVDTFWVAHLGADAVATIGFTESGLTIIFTLAIGLSIPATALVARRIGEKDPDAAARVAVQAISIGVFVSILIGALGFLYARPFLSLMGASPSVLHTGSGYTRIIYAGSITVFLLFLINAVFRGAGDASTAMRALWIANLINICLNPLLIFGLGPFPRLGVTGSAIGTTIGRGVGVLFQLYMLTRANGRIRLHAHHLRLDLHIIWSLIRLSFGSIAQFFIQTASWIGIVRLVSIFGSAAVAANTIAIKIVVFAILPSWGMSNAAATLVGQNLGARRPDRAEASVWRTGLYNMLFLGAIGVLFILFARPIIGIFTHDPSIVPLAVTCLRYLSCGYISYAYAMVIGAAFNGAGDTLTPTILNLICFWMFQIPVGYYLAIPRGLGPRGVYIMVVLADSLLALLGILWFRRGTWKQQKV